MPLVPFDKLPGYARLWVFPSSRRLDASRAQGFLQATDQFLSGWAAHRVPLATGRDWRHDQFLLVAVDESAAGASGCSIDALVRFVREQESALGVRLSDNAPVWFRGPDGAVQSVGRAEFGRLADDGRVTLDTVVFDNTIQTVEALRQGRWELPARDSWHGRAFFRAPVGSSGPPGGA